ncbi:MAG: LD-carboxypeptidase [Treponemataceae bacterium]|nr:LD-carboxypeptidase [Treponemataceae bacterium]
MIQTIEKGSKIAIAACSNGLRQNSAPHIAKMTGILRQIPLQPVLSDYIFEKSDGFSASGEERAKVLMNFYKDSQIKAIFDVSGGDVANQVLDFFDFDVIKSSGKQFWGYSDLTTILNAIYAKTGKSSVLYQIQNIAGNFSKQQAFDFEQTLINGGSNLTEISANFWQGNKLEGVLIGGNVRCFLKLAGTQYLPNFSGKVLLLESLSGFLPRIATFFAQLKQMGVFNQISGLLLGTFSQLEQAGGGEKLKELVLQMVPPNLPVAKTQNIGHAEDSKAVVIGENFVLGE